MLLYSAVLYYHYEVLLALVHIWFMFGKEALDASHSLAVLRTRLACNRQRRSRRVCGIVQSRRVACHTCLATYCAMLMAAVSACTRDMLRNQAEERIPYVGSGTGRDVPSTGNLEPHSDVSIVPWPGSVRTTSIAKYNGGHGHLSDSEGPSTPSSTSVSCRFRSKPHGHADDWEEPLITKSETVSSFSPFRLRRCEPITSRLGVRPNESLTSWHWYQRSSAFGVLSLVLLPLGSVRYSNRCECHEDNLIHTDLRLEASCRDPCSKSSDGSSSIERRAASDDSRFHANVNVDVKVIDILLRQLVNVRSCLVYFSSSHRQGPSSPKRQCFERMLIVLIVGTASQLE